MAAPPENISVKDAELIVALFAEYPEPVRVSRLGITSASAATLRKRAYRLRDAGYVEMPAYGKTLLTKKGLMMAPKAQGVLKRHNSTQ